MAKTVTTIIAIFCIAALGGYALLLGVDGSILLANIAAIAGLAGYQLRALPQVSKSTGTP